MVVGSDYNWSARCGWTGIRRGDSAGNLSEAVAILVECGTVREVDAESPQISLPRYVSGL